jgi:predicted RNA binding protein YcfA (HicA-like mRNA interferase family)
MAWFERQESIERTPRIGWSIKRTSGSHKVPAREGLPDFVFAFHDLEEIGPRMLARISKHTGLEPSDL